MNPDPSVCGGYAVNAIYFSMGQVYDFGESLKVMQSRANSGTVITVVHGGFDVQGPEVAQRYAKLLTGDDNIVYMNNSGHFPFYEAKKDFEVILRRFVQDVQNS
jgi:pimeloyl-ACP methyl ester carboxylesterase